MRFTVVMMIPCDEILHFTTKYRSTSLKKSSGQCHSRFTAVVGLSEWGGEWKQSLFVTEAAALLFLSRALPNILVKLAFVVRRLGVKSSVADYKVGIIFRRLLTYHLGTMRGLSLGWYSKPPPPPPRMVGDIFIWMDRRAGHVLGRLMGEKEREVSNVKRRAQMFGRDFHLLD